MEGAGYRAARGGVLRQVVRIIELRLLRAIPMAYVIGGGCIMCGSCAGECPVGAIAEGDGKYEINADACVDCGTCAGSCPVGAISQG